MATKNKNTKKKNSAGRKKLVARKKSTKVSAKPRKITIKSSAAKSKTAKAKSPVSSKARAATARKAGAQRFVPAVRASSGKQPKGETVRIFRSSIPTRGEVQGVESVNVGAKGLGAESGGQSGSLQALSEVEEADSESVGELLEEGNSFEAGVVKGVEDAPDADESEVHTHQRPQEKELDEDFREN